MKLKQVFFAFLLVSLHFTSCSDGEDGAPGIDGTDGTSCWDTNGNGSADENEDVNGDGNFNGLDCQGGIGSQGEAGANGISCWDTNGDGVAQESEDVNNDGNFDGLDCQGVDGTNGANGTNCWDLNGNGVADIDVDDPDSDKDEDINNDGQVDALDCQGANGQQGDPGQDGNANVRKFELDVDIFSQGDGEIGFDGGYIITNDDVENNAFLFYLENILGNFSLYLFIPGGNTSFDRYYNMEMVPDVNNLINGSDFLLILKYTNYSGTVIEPGWDDNYDILHVVMIEHNNMAMSGKNGEQALKAQLKTAGVDISDYHAVMAHFGLE